MNKNTGKAVLTGNFSLSILVGADGRAGASGKIMEMNLAMPLRQYRIYRISIPSEGTAL